MVRFSPAPIVTISDLWLSLLDINETENIKYYGKRKMVARVNLCHFAYRRLCDVFEDSGWSEPGKALKDSSDYRDEIRAIRS